MNKFLKDIKDSILTEETRTFIPVDRDMIVRVDPSRNPGGKDTITKERGFRILVSFESCKLVIGDDIEYSKAVLHHNVVRFLYKEVADKLYDIRNLVAAGDNEAAMLAIVELNCDIGFCT